MITRIMRCLAALTSLVLLSPIARADAGDCPRFLPDFSCDREARYEGFSPPISMPYLFEDPFITTEVSAHAIWHDFPWDSVFRGGDAWVAALQARVAITDRLGFFASKDGYTWLRPGDHSQISADEGFFDIAAGFKYALIDLREDAFILTPALRVELPTGERALFSGNDSGSLIPSVSSALGLGPLHLIGSTGWRLPFSTNKSSTSLFYNLHIDAPLGESLVPFLELNGTTWVRSGKGKRKVETKAFGSVELDLAQGVVHNTLLQTDSAHWEGTDVVNLGARKVAGQSLVTLAAGASIPVTDHVTLSAYYEFPISNRKDLFEQRAAVNAMYTF